MCATIVEGLIERDTPVIINLSSTELQDEARSECEHIQSLTTNMIVLLDIVR